MTLHNSITIVDPTTSTQQDVSRRSNNRVKLQRSSSTMLLLCRPIPKTTRNLLQIQINEITTPPLCSHSIFSKLAIRSSSPSCSSIKIRCWGNRSLRLSCWRSWFNCRKLLLFGLEMTLLMMIYQKLLKMDIDCSR